MKPYITALVLFRDIMNEQHVAVINGVNADGTVNLFHFHNSGHVAPRSKVKQGSAIGEWDWAAGPSKPASPKPAAVPVPPSD